MQFRLVVPPMFPHPEFPPNIAYPLLGTVYLAHAQSRGDAIKIGKAVDPDRRLNQFRTVLPDIEFVKLWEVPNAGLLERTLHRHFKGSNVGGEWFEVNVEEVAKVVQSLMA